MARSSLYWRNWSGSVSCRPARVLRPATIGGVVRIIDACRAANRRVRVAGSGHSFTPLAATDDLLVSLDLLQGIEAIDRDQGTATVLAGTTLKALGRALHDHGLSQENLGGIDAQTLAGAISTGTHGSGLEYGSLATQVEGLTLVTAAGEVVDCSIEDNPELFDATRVSLGALGIIVRLKLRVVPSRLLLLETRRDSLDNCLANFERHAQGNQHFEFFWFPRTTRVQLRFLNPTDRPGASRRLRRELSNLVVENGVLALLSECCRVAPRLSRAVSLLSAKAAPNGRVVDYSERLFASRRLFKVQALEYSIPAGHAPAALSEIAGLLESAPFPVHLPIGCRLVAADDIWLSPSYQRDSVYIAAHTYRSAPHDSYFSALEEILRSHGGRPHWGKFHTMAAAGLAACYPRWHAFQDLRESLDPGGIFMNDYLERLFCIQGTEKGPAAVQRPVPSRVETYRRGAE